MIAPLLPYAIRGAIWYQGESNAGGMHSGKTYGVQLPLLVQDWRTRWSEGDFAFAWVQLPGFKPGNNDGWSAVRESMLQTLSLPNTGMTINTESASLTFIQEQEGSLSRRAREGVHEKIGTPGRFCRSA